MKKLLQKLLLWTIAFAALPGSALQAQNLVGNWQGTLEAGPAKLRTIFKIVLQDDKLKATLYSIDQGAQGMNASTVTKDGSTVKIAFAGLGNFEGKLSADGNSIAGTWTQGAPLPLNLAKATPETAWAIPEPPPPPVPMAANANAVFDVATIKPSEPGRPGKLFTIRGQEVVTINTTLSDLITMAYGIHPKQLTGAPSWVDTDKFDITGKPEAPGQPNVDQMKIMIQKLVVDRFQLKFHRDKKELAVYTITALKTGTKIKKSEADPNSLPGLFFGRAPNGTSFNVRNATLSEVASVIQGNVLDKPVLDQTGLTDKYDFTLTFTPDPGQMAGFGPPPPNAAPGADPGDAAPDIFTAFQQQLGLKLESTKAPADVFVIDKVEKPSAN
jgi:uncharacterized protein (TIGR03435 family)